MDYSVSHVRVQPIEAVVRPDVIKVAIRKFLEESRFGDTNTGRQTHHLALDVHGDVNVDVILDCVVRLLPATDPVHGLTIASRGRREVRNFIDEDPFGSLVRRGTGVSA